MWQLVPWVSRRRWQQSADQALRQAARRDRAEHDNAVQRIINQAHQ